MKLKILFRVLLFVLLLGIVLSCSKKTENKTENQAKPTPQQKEINPDKLVGTWILYGQLQTDNTFHIEKDWKTNQENIIRGDSLESYYLLRGDIYTKLNLQTDKQFSMQQFQINTNQARYTPVTGTWKIENNHLQLSANANPNQISVEQTFDITTPHQTKCLKYTLTKKAKKAHE